MNVGDTLINAAESVRQGWVQGFSGDASRGVCAMGGILLHSDNLAFQIQCRLVLAKALGYDYTNTGEQQRMSYKCIADWNDSKFQTQENVAATLEVAGIMEHVKETMRHEKDSIDHRRIGPSEAHSMVPAGMEGFQQHHPHDPHQRCRGRGSNHGG